MWPPGRTVLWRDRRLWRMTARIPCRGYAANRCAFDKAIADHDEVYFSPSLSLNWKPNNRFSGTMSGRIGRSPMNLNLIHPGLIMTNYRTLKAGTEQFYNSSSQSLTASVGYKHTRHGLFANGMVMHSWTHVPYTMAQQLYGDY